MIKSQFGKSIYGEVIDKVLRETSSKAIIEKKLKVAGQPKIDLKQFGEGKDLNYELQIDCLPSIELKPLDKLKATEYIVKIEKSIIEEKLNDLANNQNKQFEDKNPNDKATEGDQVTFDYSAKVDGKTFEGSEGKGVQIELGKFVLPKFDNQLIGVKKNDIKIVNAVLPSNHPKKELANKKTIFNCIISNIKS